MNALVLTQGDPRGVGPELLLAVAKAGLLREGDVVVAGAEPFERFVREHTHAGPAWEVLQPLLDRPDQSVPARLGQFEALVRGVELVQAQPGRALVTAPIDKNEAMREGLPTPGHTDYLAERANVPVTMAMVGPALRVALCTVHLPISQVPTRLDSGLIERTGVHLVEALRERFGVNQPRVGVLGLNPHAGEGGRFGDEEAKVIAPAVEALRTRFPDFEIEGPMSADTAFHAHRHGRWDGLVAMYHDQALAPFKLLHFDDGVNTTLGLPYLRTSPDHGTAKDIAGRGLVREGSMLAAVKLARG